MSKEQFIYSSKNAFSSGELTPTIEGRNDLPIYQHGVKKLINWMILPSGGITRRHGTKYVHLFKSKIPSTKCMATIMYSREFSFLIIFNKIDDEKIKVELLINGDLIVIEEELLIKLDPAKFSYTSYQGIAYISFGLEYPIYSFSIDPSKVLELSRLLELTQEEKKSLFIFDIFQIIGSAYKGEKTQNELYREITLHEERKTINSNLKEAAKDENIEKIENLKSASMAVFEGRLWALGTGRNIHEIWASSLGKMNEYNLAYKSLLEARNPLSAFAATFISSTFDRILWSMPFAKELLIGTSDGIYVLKTGDRTKDEFIKINKDIDIAVSKVKPVICGKTVFFVEGDNKKIHSLYYSEEKGGYQISCITTYAEHLFNSGIKQIVAINSPFNMIFAILNNGSFASFTYSQDLKIMGWSQHWLGGDGKIMEAVPLFSEDSDKIYFRVRREGTSITKKDANKDDKDDDEDLDIEPYKSVRITREYLEYLDCSYLTASTQNKIHTPLYVDCYSHFQRDGEDEIDQMFESALKKENIFEFKEDLSNLEHLIIKQIEIEREFKEDDILNKFIIGDTPLYELENEQLIDGSDSNRSDDSGSVIEIDLKPIYVDFIRNYFSKYLKIIQLALGLEMALLRKSQEFISYMINIILGKHSDFNYLNGLKLEITQIIAKLDKHQDKLKEIVIPDELSDKQLQFITHKDNSKYSFAIVGISLLLSDKRLNIFKQFTSLIDRNMIRLKYYLSSPEFVIKRRKSELLKDFNLKSNYYLLKAGASVNVENLDIRQYIENSYFGKKGYDKNLENFKIESNKLIISNYILDNFHPESNFIEYFKIKRNELLAEDIENDISQGMCNIKQFQIEEYIRQEAAYIIARIYSSFAKELIANDVVINEISTRLASFLDLLGIIKNSEKDNIDCKAIIANLVHGFLDQDEVATNLINTKKQEWQANLIFNKIKDLPLSEQNNYANNLADDFKGLVLDKVKKRYSIQNYEQFLELRDDIDGYIEADYDEEDVDESIAEYNLAVKTALKNYWLEQIGDDTDNNYMHEFAYAIEISELISNDELCYIGVIIESNYEEENLNLVLDLAKTELENIMNNYPVLGKYKNIYLRQIFAELLSMQRAWDVIIRDFIYISNYVIPSEKHELLRISESLSYPSKIDKYLLASIDCFPIFRQLFPDIDTNMLKILTRHMNAAIDRVDSDDLHEIYGGMITAFVGDNELLKNERVSLANFQTIKFAGTYVRFLSFGFLYKSVLQSFPLIFPDEFEHIDKKDTGIGLKLFNTKGGYIEEKSRSGKKQAQFINAPRLNLDDISLYLSDKKYLMAKSINAISTPYISGWVHFNCNREISKDIDLVYVVDKPYPASMLRIYGRAKIFPHYLN